MSAALEWLLEPMKVEEFLREHWCKRTAHIQGEETRFEEFFSENMFWTALSQGEARSGDETSPFYVRAGRTLITAGQARSMFEEGMSICVNNLSAGSRRLQQFAEVVRHDLKFPGRARFNAYLSPEGTGFSGIHTDARIATTMQIEGHKRWKFAREPVVKWPYRQAFLREGKVKLDGQPVANWEREFQRSPETESEVVLGPGDVLCIPAGTWHAAEAVGGKSLSLNLSFEKAPVLDLLTPLIRSALEESARWRNVSSKLVSEATELEPFQNGPEAASLLEELRESVAALTEEDLYRLVRNVTGKNNAN